METYGERRTQHLLDTFICNRGKDEYDFLIKKAIAMEKKDLCRTYLAVNDTALLGFFTVGIKCTKVPKTPNLSKSFFIEDRDKSEERCSPMLSFGTVVPFGCFR